MNLLSIFKSLYHSDKNDYSILNNDFPYCLGFTKTNFRHKQGYALEIDKNIRIVFEDSYGYGLSTAEIVVSPSSKLSDIFIDDKKIISDLGDLLGDKFINMHGDIKKSSDYNLLKLYNSFYIRIGRFDFNTKGATIDNISFLSMVNKIKSSTSVIYDNIKKTYKPLFIDSILDNFLEIEEKYELKKGFEKNSICYKIEFYNVGLIPRLEILKRISNIQTQMENDIEDIQVSTKESEVAIYIYPKLIKDEKLEYI